MPDLTAAEIAELEQVEREVERELPVVVLESEWPEVEHAIVTGRDHPLLIDGRKIVVVPDA